MVLLLVPTLTILQFIYQFIHQYRQTEEEKEWENAEKEWENAWRKWKFVRKEMSVLKQRIGVSDRGTEGTEGAGRPYLGVEAQTSNPRERAVGREIPLMEDWTKAWAKAIEAKRRLEEVEKGRSG